jgi:hypothetical protein
MSLVALRTAASQGCGVPSTAAEPVSAGETGGTLVSTVATLPGATAQSAVASTSGSPSTSSSGGSPSAGQTTNPAHGSSGAFRNAPIPSVVLAGTTIASDATVDHQSLALALTVLGLLLTAVLLGRPWKRRGRLAAAGAPIAAAPAVHDASVWLPVEPAANREPAAGRVASPSHSSPWVVPAAPAAGPVARKRDRPQASRGAAPSERTTPRVREPALITELPPHHVRRPAPQDESWLREHATQAALVITALAGATRILARAVTRGSAGRRRH